MIIKEILQRLETAINMVAKVLHKGDHFKVLAIGFKKGMLLKEHKTILPAVLTVFEGKVIYQEGDIQRVISKYESTPIPVDLIHSVVAIEDSLCLVIQG
ncbi:MAG: hypothetical protein NTW54_07945 [Bacteroidetes bacterium]|nr:hypothetical protein [Bacteroidota bacterium]